MALQQAHLIGRERVERVDGKQFRELGMVHGFH
jgi:hypothetical protein